MVADRPDFAVVRLEPMSGGPETRCGRRNEDRPHERVRALPTGNAGGSGPEEHGIREPRDARTRQPAGSGGVAVPRTVHRGRYNRIPNQPETRWLARRGKETLQLESCGTRITLRTRHLQAVWREALADAGPHEALQETLGRWAEADPRPLVLLIDEIDMLIGDTLLAVLRQLRADYPNRPRHYPQRRGVVRHPRRARLPHPVERRERRHRRRQRLQRQGRIATPRRLQRDRGAGAARAAHRRDGTAVLGGRRRVGLDGRLRPAVAGERAMPPDVLRQQGGARPLAGDRGRRHFSKCGNTWSRADRSIWTSSRTSCRKTACDASSSRC